MTERAPVALVIGVVTRLSTTACKCGKRSAVRSSLAFTALALSSFLLLRCGSDPEATAPAVDGAVAPPDDTSDAALVDPDGAVDAAAVGTDAALIDDWFAESPCELGTPSGPLEIVTTRGVVRGEAAGNTLRFRGIPFAAAPVGNDRFKPPRPHACWSGVRDANAWGNQCLQSKTVGSGTVGDEDCLFLNVWTPSAPAGATRPVLFWIHGGANVLGSAGSDDAITGGIYDGQALADAANAVVVTTNYRLGALGFLTHPSLAAESSRQSSGNYGLLDILAALHWVQRNVGQFGGDPRKVMVFGESAGAFNTCALLASPLATDLFASALMQSGVCSTPTRARQEQRGITLAAELGCTDDAAQCLRNKPAAAFAAVQGGLSVAAGPVDASAFFDLPQGSTVDGWVLPESPIKAIEAGHHHHVPFVVGSNAHEMDFFLALTPAMTCASYEATLRDTFVERAPQVLAHYPCGALDNGTRVLSDVWTDAFFTCPARRVARAMHANQEQPVFRYWYTHQRALGSMVLLRAYHTAEIPFVFRLLGTAAEPATSSELALSKRMAGYWSNLAKEGAPNGADLTVWPLYEVSSDRVLALDTSIAAQDGVRSTACDFWDQELPDY